MRGMAAKVLIDARELHFSELGRAVRDKVKAGATWLELRNVRGQRYIGAGLDRQVRIDIYGTPGNDMAIFANGPQLYVHGNAQDGCGNTMSDGTVVIHGRAGDILGYAMRGGKIFVRDDVGYRVGIHMKENLDSRPTLVIGGTAQPFLGEYMAGGVLLLLGLNLPEGSRHPATFVGTGMHGGVIYLRGTIEPHQLGKEVGVLEMSDEDWWLVRGLVTEYVGYFGGDIETIMAAPFLKLWPASKRPYGTLYAY